MTLAEGTNLGRYEIRAKIGEGGMGEVYLAQDTKLDRKIALKILPAEVASNRDLSVTHCSRRITTQHTAKRRPLRCLHG